MNFRVVLVQPDHFIHSEGLREVAETVMYGLRALGHSAEVTSEPAFNVRNIVLCSHLLTHFSVLPEDSVLYNFEQMSAPGLESMLMLARRYRVWDYSPRNLAMWKTLRTKALPVLVPFGYVPEMSRIVSAEEQPIDVLFYGSRNQRRCHILDQLERTGLKVKALFGVYGAERDRYIAQSKVVLNLHFYESKIFEVVRVSYLLANAKAVVAECGPETEIDSALASAMVGVPYDHLVEASVSLVRNPEQRRDVEIRAQKTFAKRSEKEFLKRALERTAYAADAAAHEDAIDSAAAAR